MAVYEILLADAAAIAMSRFSEADRSEATKWGAITFGLCLVSVAIPLPFLRILLALAFPLC